MLISPKRYFKTTYAEDARIFSTFFMCFWLYLLIVGLILFPFISNSYFIYLFNLIGIYVIAALGLNILTGLSGQISIGHAAFVAIGAYSNSMLFILGVPSILSIFLGGLIAGIFGVIVAIPSSRLKGLYVAMTTFAFGFIVDHILKNMKITGGAVGLAVPKLMLGPFRIDTDLEFYFLTTVFVVLAVFIALNISRSKLGRAFGAIRDRDMAAEALGISVFRFKILAFFISSFYAGVAGGLYAFYIGYISPDHFTLLVSIQYLAMIIVGGLGTIEGTIFGSILMGILPEILRFLTNFLGLYYQPLVTQLVDVKTIIYGLVIILCVLFMPRGIYGKWVDVKTYFRKWPFSY